MPLLYLPYTMVQHNTQLLQTQTFTFTIPQRNTRKVP